MTTPTIDVVILTKSSKCTNGQVKESPDGCQLERSADSCLRRGGLVRLLQAVKRLKLATSQQTYLCECACTCEWVSVCERLGFQV